MENIKNIIKNYKVGIVLFIVWTIVSIKAEDFFFTLSILLTMCSLFYILKCCGFFGNIHSIEEHENNNKELSINEIPLETNLDMLIEKNNDFINNLDITYEKLSNRLYEILHNHLLIHLNNNNVIVGNDNKIYYDVILNKTNILSVADEYNIRDFINFNFLNIYKKYLEKNLFKLLDNNYGKYDYNLTLINDNDNFNNNNNDYSIHLKLFINSNNTNLNKIKSNNLVETNIECLKCDICKNYKKNLALGCGHIYCNDCIDSLKEYSCPYCRTPISKKLEVFL